MILLYSWKTGQEKVKETGSRDENLQLENENFQEEVSKIRMENDLLKVKKKPYYDKLQMLINEHPEIVSQMLYGNEI